MKHGMWGTPVYRVWNQLRQRCYNPRQRAYQWYGATGIQVCNEWRKSFAPIVWMKAKSGSTMPIDAGSCTPEEQNAVIAPIYDHTHHMSHHATCPHAADFRAKKR